MELTRILEHIKNLYENYDTVCKKLTTERKYSEDLQSQLTTTKEALKEAQETIKSMDKDYKNMVLKYEQEIIDECSSRLDKLEEGL